MEGVVPAMITASGKPAAPGLQVDSAEQPPHSDRTSPLSDPHGLWHHALQANAGPFMWRSVLRADSFDWRIMHDMEAALSTNIVRKRKRMPAGESSVKTLIAA